MTTNVLKFRSPETWLTNLQEYLLSGGSHEVCLDASIRLCRDQEIVNLLTWFRDDVDPDTLNGNTKAALTQGDRLKDVHSDLRIMRTKANLTQKGKLIEASAVLILKLFNFFELIKDAAVLDDDSAKENLTLFEKFITEFSGHQILLPAQCMANYLAGTFLLTRGEAKQAELYLDTAAIGLLKLDQTNYPSSLRVLAVVEGNLGQIALWNRDFSLALRDYSSARNKFVQLSQSSPNREDQINAAKLLMNQGSVLGEIGQLKQAFETLGKATRRLEELLQPEELKQDANYGLALNNLAACHLEKGHHHKAEPLLKQSIEVLSKAESIFPGRHKENLSNVLLNLAVTELEQANSQNLDAIVDRATSLINGHKNLSSRNQIAAARLSADLGSLMLKKHNIDGALAWYEQAEEICSNMENDAHLAKSHIWQSFTYNMINNLDDHVEVFRNILNLNTEQFYNFFEAHLALSLLQQNLTRYDKEDGTSDLVLFSFWTGQDDHFVIGFCNDSLIGFWPLETKAFAQLLSQDRMGSKSDFQKAATSLPNMLPVDLCREIKRSIETDCEIFICGDTVSMSLPWEILSIDRDYYKPLGLLTTLPRASDPTMINEKSTAELNIYSPLRRNRASGVAFIPYNTVQGNLDFAETECDEIAASLQAIGLKQTELFSSVQANVFEFIKSLEEQPDFLYFSGHGSFSQGEDALILHLDDSAEQSFDVGHSLLRRILLNPDKEPPIVAPRYVYLNSCITGRARTFGGRPENLPSIFLLAGSSAVISCATALPDYIGSEFSNTFFRAAKSKAASLKEAILSSRHEIFERNSSNAMPGAWMSWASLTVHGNPKGRINFSDDDQF